MTAEDQRLLDQSLRAIVRVSDWLSRLDVRVSGQIRDSIGELIYELEEMGARD